MKKNLLFLFLIITQFSIAQNIEVISVEKIIDATDGRYFYPKISPSNDYILLTNYDHNGLSLYDISKKSVKILNNDKGAGYGVSISSDGKKVLYNSVKLVNNRRHNSLVEQDVKTGTKKVIEPYTREIIKSSLIDSEPVYIRDRTMKSSKSLKSSNVDQLILTIEDRNLVLYNNNKRKLLNPNGEGKSYIWPSISPDKKHIVYTVVGEGTFVATLKGKKVKSLGKLNAPKWMSNDFVVGMVDEDDGEVLLSSKIKVSSKNGNLQKELKTPQNVKAIYPSSSSDGRTVVFNSDNGDVFLMKLEIK